MSLDQFFARRTESLKHGLRAFRHPNYRLFFLGQGVSVIGTWMQATALPWMVFELTHSEAQLGFVAFAAQIPMAVLAPFTGALSDRMDRRPILIATQTVAMLQAFILAALAFAGAVQVWHIMALSVLIGLVMAFDMPTRQAFVVEMVADKRDLPSAIALNSLMFNMGRFIGAALGGLMIAFWSPAWVFLVNAISYLAIIVTYFIMKLPRYKPVARRPRLFADIREGFVYVFRHRAIRAVLLTLAFMSLAGMSYATLLPAFAKNVLGGGVAPGLTVVGAALFAFEAATLASGSLDVAGTSCVALLPAFAASAVGRGAGAYGLLVACVGAGAVLAGLFLASRRDGAGLSRTVLLSAAGLSMGVALFAMSRWLWLSAPILLATGFCGMLMIAGSNTLLQTMVADDKRGRLMGMYGLCFLGVAPFGNLLVGLLAENKSIGPQWTLFSCGLLCLIALALLARPILAAHASHADGAGGP